MIIQILLFFIGLYMMENNMKVILGVVTVFIKKAQSGIRHIGQHMKKNMKIGVGHINVTYLQ